MTHVPYPAPAEPVNDGRTAYCETTSPNGDTVTVTDTEHNEVRLVCAQEGMARRNRVAVCDMDPPEARRIGLALFAAAAAMDKAAAQAMDSDQ